jgi:hypothetical protein
MHLHDDTYRTSRAMTADGRNVFAMALWRIERAQRLRSMAPAEWENVDIVLEQARARALDRLRRYPEAAEAYERVSVTGSLLAEQATEGAHVMQRFARYSGPSVDPIRVPEDELAFLDTRVKQWRDLAWEYRGTPYEPLAREEAEAWEMLRVDWIARNRGPEEAIQACRRLVERNHASKLYAKHLIQLDSAGRSVCGGGAACPPALSGQARAVRCRPLRSAPRPGVCSLRAGGRSTQTRSASRGADEDPGVARVPPGDLRSCSVGTMK